MNPKILHNLTMIPFFLFGIIALIMGIRWITHPEPWLLDKIANETILNEKTGLLFESGDAASLSKKIIQAMTMDETSLKLMGKEGRKNIIKKFNVEKMCFSTYSEYKRLLN